MTLDHFVKHEVDLHAAQPLTHFEVLELIYQRFRNHLWARWPMVSPKVLLLRHNYGLQPMSHVSQNGSGSWASSRVQFLSGPRKATGGRAVHPDVYFENFTDSMLV